MTFASATRMGPVWGSMSSHRNRRRGGKAQHWGGGASLPGSPSQWGGRKAIPTPPHKTTRRWSRAAGRELSGAFGHACKLTVGPRPAAPRSGSRARSPSKGGRAGQRRGRRLGERRSAAGARQGRQRRTLGTASFPVAHEAEGLAENLVHAVLDRPRPSAAEGVGPHRRGVDTPRLRQDDPPHVADHREEGVDGVGHLPPRRLRPTVGGRLAGRVVVPDRAPAVPTTAWSLPAAVVPSKRVRRRRGRRNQQGGGSSRCSTPRGRVCRHSGWPVSSRHVGARNLRHVYGRRPPRGSGRGARAKRTYGYLHCLVPKLGAAWENDGGVPNRLVLWPVTAVPTSVPGPREKVLESQDPREQHHEGSQGAGRVRRAPSLGAVWEHQDGLAVPPANQGAAVVPPLLSREGGRGGRGRVSAPSPTASSPFAASWSTRHVQKSGAAGRQGASPGRWGPGVGVGGRVVRVPRPPCSQGRQRASPAGSPRSCCPSWGGGGGGDPRSPSRPHPALGGATVPRRLRPLLYRQPPTVGWGPAPLPGPAPAPGGDPVPSPRPKAPSWAVGV